MHIKYLLISFYIEENWQWFHFHKANTNAHNNVEIGKMHSPLNCSCKLCFLPAVILIKMKILCEGLLIWGRQPTIFHSCNCMSATRTTKGEERKKKKNTSSDEHKRNQIKPNKANKYKITTLHSRKEFIHAVQIFINLHYNIIFRFFFFFHFFTSFLNSLCLLWNYNVSFYYFSFRLTIAMHCWWWLLLMSDIDIHSYSYGKLSRKNYVKIEIFFFIFSCWSSWFVCL